MLILTFAISIFHVPSIIRGASHMAVQKLRKNICSWNSILVQVVVRCNENVK